MFDDIHSQRCQRRSERGWCSNARKCRDSPSPAAVHGFLTVADCTANGPNVRSHTGNGPSKLLRQQRADPVKLFTVRALRNDDRLRPQQRRQRLSPVPRRQHGISMNQLMRPDCYNVQISFQSAVLESIVEHNNLDSVILHQPACPANSVLIDGNDRRRNVDADLRGLISDECSFLSGHAHISRCRATVPAAENAHLSALCDQPLCDLLDKRRLSRPPRRNIADTDDRNSRCCRRQHTAVVRHIAQPDHTSIQPSERNKEKASHGRVRLLREYARRRCARLPKCREVHEPCEGPRALSEDAVRLPRSPLQPVP